MATVAHRRTRGRRVLPATAVAFALLASCYVAGPFVTLWQIARACETGDLAVLQGSIDWGAVRQGLKDDIAEGVVGMPPQALLAGNVLPPFGAGFMNGIAATEVDRSVTPQGLREAADVFDPAAHGGSALPSIVDAGFTTPTRFDLRVHLPCQGAEEPPLHLRLAFYAGSWRVVRVWVPQDLMDRAGARI